MRLGLSVNEAFKKIRFMGFYGVNSDKLSMYITSISFNNNSNWRKPEDIYSVSCMSELFLNNKRDKRRHASVLAVCPCSRPWVCVSSPAFR